MKLFSLHKAKQVGAAYTFLLPTLAILGLFSFYPMFHAFALSLWDYSPMSQNNKFVGLDNFSRLLHDPNFWLALKNSLLYLVVVPVIIGLSLALALLVEPRIPFINFFRACYYLPVVTMMVVVALVWKFIFDTDNGILNHVLNQLKLISEGIPWLTSERLALFTVMTVTVWKGLGYYMVMFIVGLKSVPKELLEAARIDGARAHQVLLHVKLPLLWPIVTLTAIISSISALQVFEEIYIMTSGKIGTTTLVYEIYETGFSQTGSGMEMGYACAIGVVLFALLLVFSVFTVKGMERMHRVE